MNGIITAVDRDREIVHARLESHEVIECGYLGGIPPWPLAGGWFTEDPEPLFLGAYGHRRPVFHDDFMWGFAPTTSRWDADTGWGTEFDGSATITDLDDPGPTAAGAVALTSNAGEARLRKLLHAITPPDDGAALWLTVRLKADEELLVTQGNGLGLATPGVPPGGGTDQGVDVVLSGFNYAGGVELNTYQSANTPSVLGTGESLTAGDWHWLDLLVIPRVAAALWMDGSGPWVNTDNPLDPDGDAITVYFLAAHPDGDVAELDLDLVDLSIVTPVNNPSDFAIAGTR